MKQMWTPTLPPSKVPVGIPIEWCDFSDDKLISLLESLVGNIQTLASSLDASRPDIALALDMIIDTLNPNPDFIIKHTNMAGCIGNQMIIADRTDRMFKVYDRKTGELLTKFGMLTKEQIANKLDKE